MESTLFYLYPVDQDVFEDDFLENPVENGNSVGFVENLIKWWIGINDCEIVDDLDHPMDQLF